MTPIPTLLVENHDHPYVTFHVGLRTGSLTDPRGKEGLAALAANMLSRGTATRTHAQIVEDVDVLGSMLDISVGKEVTVVRSDALKRNLPKMLDIVSEILSRPSFPPAELDKLRRHTQSELKDLRNHDEYLARHFFHLFLYDGHPYGRPGKGTLTSLDRVTREDVEDHVRRRFHRGNLFVACSGDVTRTEVDGLVERYLGALPDGTGSEEDFPPLVPVDGRSVLVVDKPDRTQTQVVLGHFTIDAGHEDYFPLLLANTVFGGTFTARLSQEIREKRGWSYGAYSFFSPSRRAGSLSMRFYPNNEQTRPAIELSLDLFEQLARDGLREEELDFAKSYLIKQFPFKIDTPPKRIEQEMWGYVLGWPPDFLDRYVENVRAVTLDQVNAALRRHVHPEDIAIVVLGTASVIRDELARIPRVRQVLVHPHDQEWPLAENGPRR